MRPSEIERIKLFSNYLNGIAISIFAIGGIGFVYQIMESGEDLNSKAFAKYAAAGVLSIAIHMYAQVQLRRLDKGTP